MRERQNLVRDLERLARLEPGGSPERPIAIDSPAIVEIRAVAKPCPLCEGPLRLDEHAAEEIDAVLFRVASVRCTLCGVRRSIYFHLVESVQ
jgi:hypothetical protein